MAGVTTQPCACGQGVCAIPAAELLVAVEDGRAFLVPRVQAEDRWQVDLSEVRGVRQLGDDELSAIRNQVQLQLRLIEAQDVTVVELARLPGDLGYVSRGVIVSCSPCGHQYIADV